MVKQLFLIVHECVLSHINHVQLFLTPWAVALQVSSSMGVPRQEYWSGLPFPSPGDLPNPGIKLRAPGLANKFFTAEPTGYTEKIFTSLVIGIKNNMRNSLHFISKYTMTPI